MKPKFNVTDRKVKYSWNRVRICKRLRSTAIDSNDRLRQSMLPDGIDIPKPYL
jgi:hypothetical protein